MTNAVQEAHSKINTENAKRRRQFWSIVPYMLLCMFVLLVGWMGWGNILSEERGVWFAKSGACVTALTIVISQRIQILEGMIFPRTSFVPIEVSQLWLVWTPKLKTLQRINLCLGILSALIWGYGDTLFKFIQASF